MEVRMGFFNFIPFLFLIAWLGAIVYAILLATRLVKAVEQIARLLEQRPAESPNS
jgi:multisubunit Na+/H+ antiporter MnhE subunit